jgi:hypothetical protein
MQDLRLEVERLKPSLFSKPEKRGIEDEELLTVLWHADRVHAKYIVHHVVVADEKMILYRLEQMQRLGVSLVTRNFEDKWSLTPTGKEYAVDNGLSKRPKPTRRP